MDQSPTKRDKRTHLWSRDPLDWYVEPRWCSERLFAAEKFTGQVWDPCAGTGHIVAAGRDAGLDAHGSDIDPRGFDGVHFQDFTLWTIGKQFPVVDNIVTNPPYTRAKEFAEAALAITRCKVAMFMGANWVQGNGRSQWLESTPLKCVLFICPRPSCPPGQFLLDGGKAGNGRADFVWCIWEQGYRGRPEIGWCRR